MVGAYAMLDNGGKKVQPTLIDRIQDRYGKTIYRHDQRECRGCDAPKWENQNEPTLVDKRERVIDPMTAYQITSIMEGVVQRGTATVVKEVGKPIAGKTGTTNDEKDAWFIGFSPDLVVGVYIGYDKPRHMGKGATGGVLAAPIVRDFMKVALADKPAVPFRVPAGIKLIRIDAKSGMRAAPGDQRVILEAFKPGTAPPDGYSVIGVTDAEGRPLTVSPEADNMVRSRPAPAGCTERRASLFPTRVRFVRASHHARNDGVASSRASWTGCDHAAQHDPRENRSRRPRSRRAATQNQVPEHRGSAGRRRNSHRCVGRNQLRRFQCRTISVRATRRRYPTVWNASDAACLQLSRAVSRSITPRNPARHVAPRRGRPPW